MLLPDSKKNWILYEAHIRIVHIASITTPPTKLIDSARAQVKSLTASTGK